MYLMPRLVGVSTYFIVLISTCFLISKLHKRYLKRILFIYTIILTIMAYNFVPAPGNDLYRLFDTLHYYGNQSFSELIQMMSTTSTPMTSLYFYLIGKINIDGLLPAITTFIFYTNIFYIFTDFAFKYNIRRRNISLAIFVFMSTGSYFEVISGIRTMLGFSIIAICVYKEFFENKNAIKNILWYIIASLIHPVALSIVLIRMIFLMMENHKKGSKKIINILILIFISLFLLVYGNLFVSSMLEKGIEYVKGNTYYYFWEYAIGIIMLILIFYVQVLKKKRIANYFKDLGIIHWVKFSNIVCFITFISLFLEYNTFHRYIIFNSILFTPVVMSVLEIKTSKKLVYTIRNIVIILSVIIAIISGLRGNLCSLKFFI